jgi:hypothetical protein
MLQVVRPDWAKEAPVTPVSKNNPSAGQPEAKRSPRRERRATKEKPGPAEVAAEAAAIYPDTSATPPTPEEIAAEAYAIYQARGGEHGRHEEDWLEAERRLTERRRQQRS